jgi:hypothetical protein
MTVETRVIMSPVPSISVFYHIWPVAGLGAALIVTAAWTGLLGYELFQLVF